MNIYDFDKTIYKSDSTKDFYFYCLKRYPKMLLTVPMTAWAFLLYVIGIWSKTKFKEKMYGFLRYVDDAESAAEDFWKLNHRNIKPYYYKTKRSGDIVISASPEFLLKPIAKRLGFGTLIASQVNPKTGRYTGENCWGEEKVRRLYELMPNAECDTFYSDSLSDSPLAHIAKKAYIVKGDELLKWEDVENDRRVKLRRMFLSREFITFLFIGGINTLNGVLFSMLYNNIIPNANLAFAAGYVTSTVISYLLNSALTFKERLGIIRYIKFFISYIPNFIIQNIVVFIVYNTLHAPALTAYILAAVIGVPVTFALMKLFAFRKK